MPNFTPGPWDKMVKLEGFTAIGANTLIARVYSTAFKDLENERANANLIAAAPDMHKALKAFADWPVEHPVSYLEFESLRRNAIAILAKAEGR